MWTRRLRRSSSTRSTRSGKRMHHSCELMLCAPTLCCSTFPGPHTPPTPTIDAVRGCRYSHAHYQHKDSRETFHGSILCPHWQCPIPTVSPVHSQTDVSSELAQLRHCGCPNLPSWLSEARNYSSAVLTSHILAFCFVHTLSKVVCAHPQWVGHSCHQQL